MTTLPDVDCPNCDSAAGTLEVIRSDVRGLKWVLCSVCGKTALLDEKNRVVHRPAR